MRDEGYFSDFLDYSKTGEDFEALLDKITLVYKNLDEFLGISHTNIIERE